MWPDDFRDDVRFDEVEWVTCGLCDNVARMPVCVYNAASCLHVFCGECIADHQGQLESKGQDLSACPHPSCGEPTVVANLHAELSAEKFILERLLPTANMVHQKRQHWTPEQRKRAVYLDRMQGWNAVTAQDEFQTLNESTFRYWKTHPYMLETDRNKSGQGRKPFFEDAEEENIRTELFRKPVPLRRHLTQLIMDHAKRKVADAASSGTPIVCLKAGATYIHKFAHRRDIVFHIPHPSSKRFAKVMGTRRGEEAYEPGEGELGADTNQGQTTPQMSQQELDMIYSLADARAKRMVLENIGLPSDINVVACDECRLKPSLLFGEGREKVCVDSRIKGAKRQRAYVPLSVSTSFSGITCVSTVTLAGRKLALMLVTDTKYQVSVQIPTKEWLVSQLKLTPEQTANLPATLLVVAQSKTTFNNANLHTRVYGTKVLGQIPELEAWKKQVPATPLMTRLGTACVCTPSSALRQLITTP